MRSERERRRLVAALRHLSITTSPSPPMLPPSLLPCHQRTLLIIDVALLRVYLHCTTFSFHSTSISILCATSVFLLPFVQSTSLTVLDFFSQVECHLSCGLATHLEVLAYRFPRQLAPGAFHLQSFTDQFALSYGRRAPLVASLSALRVRWRGVGSHATGVDFLWHGF